MTNYETMTDDELRCEIAERLGWQMRDTTHALGEQYRDRRYQVTLYDPSGNDRRHIDDYRDNCTPKGLMEQLWNLTMCENIIPNWAQDANAALTLIFAEKEAEIVIDEESIVFKPVYYHYHSEGYRQACRGEWPQTIARALTIAWLRWQDAKGETE
jgi:hypothetical protein